MLFNSGASTTDTLTTFDGLGRAVLVQRRQGPGASNFDSVETQYDADGRAYRVSMPYTATAGVKNGVYWTTTSFDALGRRTSVTDAAGGYTDYSYTGNDTLIARGPAPSGENVKQRQLEMDGLGRLSSVCEITQTLPGYGTCGQTQAELGYWTKYTRNTRGQITSVVQNAQGSPQETRTFSFDELGRMTAETTPESGTTDLAFDAASGPCAASPGDLVERTDANGNITCYTHDALHRMTQISYPSGPNASATPTKTFVYDAATVDGIAMTDAKGRLAEAYTGNRGTDEGFSYNALGQPVYGFQFTAGNWYNTGENYYPNGAAASLSLAGVPTITFGLDGEGRPTTVSASTGQNPVTSAAYSALGLTSMTLGSGDSDAYGYNATTGKMNQYQFQVNGAADTGTLTWNADGSLGQLERNQSCYRA